MYKILITSFEEKQTLNRLLSFNKCIMSSKMNVHNVNKWAKYIHVWYVSSQPDQPSEWPYDISSTIISLLFWNAVSIKAWMNAMCEGMCHICECFYPSHGSLCYLNPLKKDDQRKIEHLKDTISWYMSPRNKLKCSTREMLWMLIHPIPLSNKSSDQLLFNRC